MIIHTITQTHTHKFSSRSDIDENKMNHLLNSDQDVLPTNHNRKVHNRYSKSNDLKNRNSFSILFYINLLLVFAMYFVFVGGLLTKYKSLSEKIRISEERREKIESGFNKIDSDLNNERQRNRKLVSDKLYNEKRLEEMRKNIREKKKQKSDAQAQHGSLLEKGKERIGKTISHTGEAYTDDELENRFVAKGEVSAQIKMRLQSMGRNAISEKFGEAPFKVRFDILLKEEKKYFIVETASLELMPHSIHLFLEQVYHHLWDGCSFLLGLDNIIQASPYRDITLRDRSLEQKFRKLELDTVSFQEYHETYPGVKWTLAFSGRPGGPDFYINMADNAHLFGPGSHKTAHILEEEGDPVFARVIEGFDTVTEISQLPKRPPGNFFTNPAVIEKATILGVTQRLYRQSFYDEGYFGLHLNNSKA